MEDPSLPWGPFVQFPLRPPTFTWPVRSSGCDDSICQSFVCSVPASPTPTLQWSLMPWAGQRC